MNFEESTNAFETKTIDSIPDYLLDNVFLPIC